MTQLQHSRRSVSRIALERTVGFVDLSGFTALTNTHGDTVAINTLDRFEQLTQRALGSRDRLVKTIGDGVMLAFPNPAAGIDAIARLFNEAAAEQHLPLLRAGLHHGPVIVRHADLFGATVNLAAHVAAQASSGQLLATRPVATTARDRGHSVNDLGPCEVHNVVDAVPLYEIIVDRGLTHRDVDPVCRVGIPDPQATERIDLAGRRYSFCSTKCAALFSADPYRYLDGRPEASAGPARRT